MFPAAHKLSIPFGAPKGTGCPFISRLAVRRVPTRPRDGGLPPPSTASPPFPLLVPRSEPTSEPEIFMVWKSGKKQSQQSDGRAPPFKNPIQMVDTRGLGLGLHSRQNTRPSLSWTGLGPQGRQTTRPPLASRGCGWALRILKQGRWRRRGRRALLGNWGAGTRAETGRGSL